MIAEIITRYIERAALRRHVVSVGAIVLSYDDGPGPIVTEKLYQLLASNNRRSTFFPLGRRVVLSPDIVKAIAGAGHEVGTHSQEHLHAWRSQREQVLEDVRLGFRTMQPWMTQPYIFRPPHGKMTRATRREVRRHGARIGWWNIDSGDTWPALPSVSSVVDRVRAAGGGVVLMHDHHEDETRSKFVLDLTRALIEMAHAEGLKLMTLGQLLDHDGVASPAPVAVDDSAA